MDYRIEHQRLYVDDRRLSLFSGSFQYWRIEPSLWAPILQAVKGMGFSMIETYMPWSVHETAPGRFDFGQTEAAKDLPRFLDECKRAEVRVLARPGPHINAEMTYFGYPKRLFADEDLLARCADGTAPVLPAPPRMFPLLCYHHPRFQAELRVYLEALAGALGSSRAIHPEGPIVAIQADNECSKFMRTHPFDWDYSEHAVRLYRSWLESRYGSLDALNKAYGTGFASWLLVDPPRRAGGAGLVRLLDWVEFGEHYINESIRVVAEMLRGLFGEAVPLFHNYPVTLPVPPLDMTGAERFLDFQGVDSYPTREAYQGLRAGVKYTSAMSRLPFMAEFSSGSIYYGFPLTLDDQSFTTWATLMHGMRGINFYMIVERERWYGSPVKRDGSKRQRHYDFFTGLLDRVRGWGLEDMDCERGVLLLLNRDCERLANLCTVPAPNSRLLAQFTGMFEKPADMLISDETFGLSEPVASRYARVLAFWYWALSAAGAQFAMGDTSAGAGTLAEYRVVIAPTFEFMDAGAQDRLLEYAREGGTLVVGPRSPRLDPLLRPHEALSTLMRDPVEVVSGGEVFGAAVEELSFFEDGDGRSFTYRVPCGEGWLVHLGVVPLAVCSAADAGAFAPMVSTMLMAAGVEPSFVPSEARLDVSVWRSGGRTVVFVANPTDEQITATLSHTGGASLRDLDTGAVYEGKAFEIETGAYTVTALGAGL